MPETCTDIITYVADWSNVSIAESPESDGRPETIDIAFNSSI